MFLKVTRQYLLSAGIGGRSFKLSKLVRQFNCHDLAEFFNIGYLELLP